MTAKVFRGERRQMLSVSRGSRWQGVLLLFLLSYMGEGRVSVGIVHIYEDYAPTLEARLVLSQPPSLLVVLLDHLQIEACQQRTKRRNSGVAQGPWDRVARRRKSAIKCLLLLLLLTGLHADFGLSPDTGITERWGDVGRHISRETCR